MNGHSRIVSSFCLFSLLMSAAGCSSQYVPKSLLGTPKADLSVLVIDWSETGIRPIFIDGTTIENPALYPFQRKHRVYISEGKHDFVRRELCVPEEIPTLVWFFVGPFMSGEVCIVEGDFHVGKGDRWKWHDLPEEDVRTSLINE